MDETTNVTEATEQKDSVAKDKKVVSRTVCVLLAVLALIIGGLGGYAYGNNTATTEAQKQQQQEAAALENDVNKAKAAVGNEAQEGKQTVESLQAENAALKTTIEQQNAKIADLQKQLEEAKKVESTTPQ